MADGIIVTVFINNKGEASIDYAGGEGTNCMDLFKGFDLAMGANMDTVVYKPEYYQKRRERAVILRNGMGDNQ